MRLPFLPLCWAGILALGPVPVRAATWSLEEVAPELGEGKRPAIGRSVAGAEMMVAGQPFSTGIGLHSGSFLQIDLHKNAKRLVGAVGLQDGNRSSGAGLLVFGDGRLLWNSGLVNSGEAPKPFDVDLNGVRILALKVIPGHDFSFGDHVNLIEAALEYSGKKPESIHPDEVENLTEYDLTQISLAEEDGRERPVIAGMDPTGGTLSIASETFSSGFWMHSGRSLKVSLGGSAKSFTAKVGVQDGQKGSMEFVVLGDGRELARVGPLQGGEAAVPLSADLQGIEDLELQALAGPGGEYQDHGVWGDPILTLDGVRPKTAGQAP
jgi:hypothetical protein